MNSDSVVPTSSDLARKLHLLTKMVDQDPLRLIRRIKRIVHDQMVAEDLSQDALLRAIRALPDFRGEPEEEQLCSWLNQIARNLAYNYLRDSARRPWQASLEEKCHDSESLAEQYAVSTTDPAFIASQAETHAHLVKLIQKLPTDARKVFLLREIEGCSTATTSEKLHISQDLVKWRLQRARKLLRQQLLAPSDLSPRC